jgi:putative copper export protein
LIESRPDQAWLRGRASRLGGIAAVLLPIAIGFFFLRQLIEFRDPFVPWTEDAELLLTGTNWGRTWTVGLVGVLLATAGFTLAIRGKAWGWWIATVAVVCLAAFPAFTGHANGEESLRGLTLAADTLHVLAATGWVGGLTLVLYSEHHWRRTSPEEPASLLPSLVPAFSPLAIACVGTLMATGLYASIIHIDGFSALWATGYGRLLVLKLVIVFGVMSLGALNWKRLTPRLGEAAGRDALRRAAGIEMLLAHGVLLVTAMLVRTSPM